MLLFGILSVPPGLSGEAAPLSGDGEVVARVNGVEITKGEVRLQTDLYERAHPGLSPQWRGQRAASAARTLVENVLLEELGRQLNVRVSEPEVEAKYAEFKGATEEGIFQGLLRVQGSNPAKLRQDIHKGLLDMKIKTRLMESVVVTESDLRAKFQEEKATFYPEQVKAREIIVLTYDLATRLYQELLQGADFASLARSTSTDKSRSHGGELGWVPKGQRYAPFDDVVFKLRPGQIGRPFQSPHGYHIVKVEGYRPEGWGSLDEKRPVLETQIRAFRAERDKERRMEEVRKRATIWVAERIDLDAAPMNMNRP